MGGMEWNKIFAAVLVAGIIAMFGGFVAKMIVHPHKLEKDAFTIEAMEGAGGAGGAKAAMPEPILAMIGAADASKGEKIAKACAACHTFNKGGANGVGPNLYGVVGGPKDHIAGFAYSGELLKHGGNVWTYAELNKFLWKPKTYAPGTKMSFAGLKKPEDRAALLAWLRTQADAEKPLPTEGEIAAEQAELAPPATEGAAPTDGAAAPAATETGTAPAGKDGANATPAKPADTTGQTVTKSPVEAEGETPKQ